MASDIPPEILHLIVGHLDCDTPTLRALSTVSKSCLSISRAFGFRAIIFDSNGHSRFLKFLQFASLPSTSFLTSVTSLHFCGTKWDPKAEYPLADLDVIAANLPNLHSASLKTLTFDKIPAFVKILLERLRLDTLHLDSIDFTFPNQITSLLDWIPSTVNCLTALHTWFTSYTNLPGDVDLSGVINGEGPGSARRKALHFSDIDACTLGMLGSIRVPASKSYSITVDAFHLQIFDWAQKLTELHEPLIERFIQTMGPSLQHIIVDLDLAWGPIYGRRDPAKFIEKLDFSGAKSLRTAQIGVLEWHPAGMTRFGYQQRLAEQIVDILIKSPALEQLTIDLRPYWRESAIEGLASIRYDADWFWDLKDLQHNSLKRICLRILVKRDQMEDYAREIRLGQLPFVGLGLVVAKIICSEELMIAKPDDSLTYRTERTLDLVNPAKRVILSGEDEWLVEKIDREGM